MTTLIGLTYCIVDDNSVFQPFRYREMPLSLEEDSKRLPPKGLSTDLRESVSRYPQDVM